MPIYATTADVQAAIGADRLLDIADHNGDRVLDLDTVERALAEASSIADSYLDDEEVPDPYPVALRRAVVDIAVQFLREPRDRSTDSSQRAHDSAIKWLERIAEGKATLTPSPSSPLVDTDPGDPLIVSGDRVWSRDRTSRLL